MSITTAEFSSSVMLEERKSINPRAEEYDPFFSVINRLFGLFSREAQARTENDPASEYPFVAMDTRQVYDQLQFVSQLLYQEGRGRQDDVCTFIDIGCGIGNVMLLAEPFGFEVHGIEKDANPRQVAEKLFGPGRVLAEDVFGYDGYGGFDVVYYFRPLADKPRQIEFERLVEEGMRPGAILIANGRYSSLDGDSGFDRLHPDLPIWRKQ